MSFNGVRVFVTTSLLSERMTLPAADSLSERVRQLLCWVAFDACARSFRQLRVRDDDEGASEAGGCVRVTVMNIVDSGSGTVCATRVAENARTSKSR